MSNIISFDCGLEFRWDQVAGPVQGDPERLTD